MQKAYDRTYWENYPSDKSPINKYNLNKISSGLDEVDNRVIALDTTKLDKVTAATMVKDVTFDEGTGIFTVTYLNGATYMLDTKLEKLAMNWSYDRELQKLIITLDDGTEQAVDLSALITQYEFVDTDIIMFTIGSDGKVSATIKDSSITENKLQPNFLADIKVEAANAAQSASEAATSASNASASEVNAKGSESAAANSASSAESHKNVAEQKASEAATSASNAASSEANAKASEEASKASEEAAEKYAQSASESASQSADSAEQADLSAQAALDSETASGQNAENAANHALKAQSYASGGTRTRENEDVDNAEYYYSQIKNISESIAGALRPIGTVPFADLPSASDAVAGDMYDIEDEFVTTDEFRGGAGYTHPAGTNVYLTSDGLWDCLAGSPVTSVNGKRGNVVLDAEDVGLGNVPNVATNDQTPTYGVVSALAELVSGEKLSVAFGKIAKAVSNIISHLSASNPHGITKSAVGLGNADNTADADKSVKYAASAGTASSCSGNAATATKATNADYATNAGSANAVAWGNVSGKPALFTKYTLNAINIDSTSGDWSVDISDTSHGTVPSTWVNVIQTTGDHFYTQIAHLCHNTTSAAANSRMWIRNKYSGGVWNNWRELSYSGHTHNYAGSSSAGGAANLSEGLRYFQSGWNSATATGAWSIAGSLTPSSGTKFLVTIQCRNIGHNEGISFGYAYNDGAFGQTYGNNRTCCYTGIVGISSGGSINCCIYGSSGLSIEYNIIAVKLG